VKYHLSCYRSAIHDLIPDNRHMILAGVATFLQPLASYRPDIKTPLPRAAVIERNRAMQSRLMRSRTEVIVAGVCGGLAQYFGLDPVIVRLIFVLVTLTTGIGFIAYPVLWLVMP